jgi:peptide-methionine (S)-S-oxide reductase
MASMLDRLLSIGAHGQRMPRPDDAPRGRPEPVPLENRHFVHGRPLRGDFEGLSRAVFGMGCFWGAERLFWSIPGVHTTAVGYAGGATPNPTYHEVCSGMTGHAEVVLVVFDPAVVGYDALLARFWEGHDPTQGMRQGNDVGTQYRSVIHCGTPAQEATATASRDRYAARLSAAGLGAITTEIVHPAPTFFYAEDAHQQYLAKHPGGYCGLGGTGVSCPVGTGA